MGELVRLDRGRPRAGVDPLWRELTGRQLRRQRLRRQETLAHAAARAGVSTQYQSELERGVKDPSSEILAAVAGAVGLTLLDLTTAVARELSGRGGLPTSVDLVAPETDPVSRPVFVPAPQDRPGSRGTAPLALAA